MMPRKSTASAMNVLETPTLPMSQPAPTVPNRSVPSARAIVSRPLTSPLRSGYQRRHTAAGTRFTMPMPNPDTTP